MNRIAIAVFSLMSMLCLASDAMAQEARILVQAGRPGPSITRNMTGVCIEDVNHELYGGIDSQMLFGESFQEPPVAKVAGFAAYGGGWTVEGDVLRAAAGDGPKLIAERPPLATGEVSVQVRFAGKASGLAGLIMKVSRPGVGADRFQGYEVSLDPGRQLLVLGRHRQNWEHIRDVPCSVAVGRWVDLTVRMTGTGLAVVVDGRPVVEFEDREHPLSAGSVGLRTWQREASFRGLKLRRGDQSEKLAFRAVDPHGDGGVSRMWRTVRRGSATGRLAPETEQPFAGSTSQRITFTGGAGAIGVENRGLNRRGLSFAAGKPYEGYLWIRADQPAEVRIAAESGDGSRTFGEAVLKVAGSEWKRYDFTLTPSEGGEGGRFAVTLAKPGSVVLGYAFLQPGPWGRFHGLPVRRDVTEGLIDEGVTVMRLGGSMVNAQGYRWKNMIGPRDRRPPYRGTWYPYSSNGWGIFEFLGLCEAAGFQAVVAVNMDETPQDLADLVEYANGPADSTWGRRRTADGHPAPYRLKYLELGNEEAVDEAYWRRFRPMAEAIWAKDPQIILIVGDFEYRQPIADPDHFEGAPRIKTLAAHKKILDLTRARGREVWFDVHIWNHNPREARGRIAALASFDAALAKLSPGAPYRLCVLEENAINHAVRRAVAHGETVNGLMRMGDRVPIVCAANALQPDGQNDNGWDQGLLFLNPSKVWLQPPGYVTRMISRNVQPVIVEATASRANSDLDVTATRSVDGAKLVVQVANVGDQPRPCRIQLEGFTPSRPTAKVEELTGPLDAVNTATDPARIAPRPTECRLDATDGGGRYTFPPHSFTVLRFEGKPAAKIVAVEVPPALGRVTIDDPFWSRRLDQWRRVTLPDVLNKLEKDGALRNFEAVRDGKKVKHGGPPWEDGLLYETMRAASDFLAEAPDPALAARLDRIIALIVAAQAKGGDGYIETWTQLEVPTQRWGLNGGNEVWQHDIDNAGALVEAAVHHARATGKTTLLQVALKMVDRMRADLGPPPRHPQIPGHALAEMALVELYQLLHNDPALAERIGMKGRADEPLRLAEYFIDARGHHEGRKDFGAYDQDHEPAVRQSTAEGHAVRATLFYAGLVEAGLADGRPEYLAAAGRIWANMDGRRSHVTGGVGARAAQERFGRDDELPSDAYLETCASVGAAAFHRAMLRASTEARFADAIERTLYNGTLGGVGSDGDSYFYVNPLRGGPRVRRWDWHDCPCCPPMFLKQMAMLPADIYATGPDTVFVNQFIGSRARLDVGGVPVELRLTSRYLNDGSVRIAVQPDRPRRFTLAVRVPSWCRPPAEDALYRTEVGGGASPRFKINGRPIAVPAVVRGYAQIEREWAPGDAVEVTFPIVPARVHAHPRVRDLAGQVALARGPVLYLFEGIDNGGDVAAIRLSADATIRAVEHPDFPGGPPALEVRNGDRRVVAIPFFARANRAPTSFTVWVPEAGSP